MPDAVHWTAYAIQLNYVLVHRKYKAIISIPKAFSLKNLLSGIFQLFNRFYLVFQESSFYMRWTMHRA